MLSFRQRYDYVSSCLCEVVSEMLLLLISGVIPGIDDVPTTQCSAPVGHDQVVAHRQMVGNVSL